MFHRAISPPLSPEAKIQKISDMRPVLTYQHPLITGYRSKWLSTALEADKKVEASFYSNILAALEKIKAASKNAGLSDEEAAKQVKYFQDEIIFAYKVIDFLKKDAKAFEAQQLDKAKGELYCAMEMAYQRIETYKLIILMRTALQQIKELINKLSRKNFFSKSVPLVDKLLATLGKDQDALEVLPVFIAHLQDAFCGGNFAKPMADAKAEASELDLAIKKLDQNDVDALAKLNEKKQQLPKKIQDCLTGVSKLEGALAEKIPQLNSNMLVEHLPRLLGVLLYYLSEIHQILTTRISVGVDMKPLRLPNVYLEKLSEMKEDHVFRDILTKVRVDMGFEVVERNTLT